jgi:hypothetical protein
MDLRRGLTTAILAAALLAPLRSGAIFFPEKTLADLVREADLVVAGTVSGIESSWADDRSTIFTFVTLTDLTIIDGDYTGDVFTLRLDGGVVVDEANGTGKGLGVSDVPELDKGDRVVAFVRGNGWDVCPFVGCAQGLLRVRADGNRATELHGWFGDRRLAAVGARDDRLEFELPAHVATALGGVRDDDPRVDGMRKAREAEREQARLAAQRAIAAKRLSLEDFAAVVRARADALRAEGRKTAHAARSADPVTDRAGRSRNAARHP